MREDYNICKGEEIAPHFYKGRPYEKCKIIKKNNATSWLNVDGVNYFRWDNHFMKVEVISSLDMFNKQIIYFEQRDFDEFFKILDLKKERLEKLEELDKINKK